jgi:ribosomal protein L37E
MALKKIVGISQYAYFKFETENSNNDKEMTNLDISETFIEEIHPFPISDQCFGASRDHLVQLEDPLEHSRNTFKDCFRRTVIWEWQCLLCFQQCQTRKSAIGHFKSHLSCDQCGKNFAGGNAANNLKCHKRKCHEPQQTTCQFCKLVYKSPRHMSYHLKQCASKPKPESESKKKKDFICHYCGIDKKNSNLLKEHLESCVKGLKKRKKKNPMTCQHCGQVYRYPRRLMAHLKNCVAKPKKETFCHFCGKDKKSPSLLKEHLTSCGGYEESMNPMTCLFCGIIYKNAACVKYHLKTCTYKPKSVGEKVPKNEDLEEEIEHPMIIDQDQVPVKQEPLKASRVTLATVSRVTRATASQVTRVTRSTASRATLATVSRATARSKKDLKDDQVPVKKEPLEHGEDLDDDMVDDSEENPFSDGESQLVWLETAINFGDLDRLNFDNYVHSKRGDWECLVCFHHSKDKHLAMHHFKSHLSCQKCGKTWNDQNSIDKKIQNLTKHQKKCRWIPDPAIAIANENDHSVTISLGPLGQSSGLDLNNLENFVRELANRDWQCLLCFHTSTTRTTAKTHLKTHISCNRCGKNWAGLKATERLRCHQKSCRGPKQLICHFCGLRQKRPSYLKRHLKNCKTKRKMVENAENVIEYEVPTPVKQELLDEVDVKQEVIDQDNNFDHPGDQEQQEQQELERLKIPGTEIHIRQSENQVFVEEEEEEPLNDQEYLEQNPLVQSGGTSIFKSEEDYDNYLRHIVSTGQWQCLLCFSQKATQNLAKIHIKSHISCERCGKNWAGRRASISLKSHLKTCQGRKETICQFCGIWKQNPSRLKEHEKYCQNNSNDESKPMIISSDPVQVSSDQVQISSDQVSGASESGLNPEDLTDDPLETNFGDFSCDHCGQKFANRSADLKKHLVACIKNPDNEVMKYFQFKKPEERQK